jgi:predicted PurR-regulated permease PerM
MAIVITYLLGFGLVFGLLAVVVSRESGDISSLLRQLPIYLHRVQSLDSWLAHELAPFGVTSGQLQQLEQHILDALRGIGRGAVEGLTGALGQVLGVLVDAVLVLVLSIYFSIDGRRLVRWIPAHSFARSHEVTSGLRIVNDVVGGYVRGTVTMCFLVGVAVGLGMWILRVPHPLLLGLIAFFMEFVPVVGVIISGGLCVLVALFVGPITAVLALAYFVLIQVLEGDVVGPRIMGNALGIHPAVALIAFIVGSELFGIWGALFGAPIAGLLQAFTVAAYQQIQVSRGVGAAQPSEPVANGPPPDGIVAQARIATDGAGDEPPTGS